MKRLLEQIVVKGSRIISRNNSNGTLLILIYHSVFEDRDFMRPNEPTREEFYEQMSLISRYFNPISLPKAVSMMRSGELPANSVAVTFDDGYMNNYTVAKPILDTFKIPATFYISTGFSAGQLMWNDKIIETIRSIDRLDLSVIGLGSVSTTTPDLKRTAAELVLTKIKHLDFDQRAQIVAEIESQNPTIIEPLMMSEKEIKSLHSEGYEIAGHTVSHPILKLLDNDEAQAEILDGKRKLEEIIGDTIVGFAYPNGKRGDDYCERDVALIKSSGFEYAVSTHWGVNEQGDDIYQLMRFTPWDRTRIKFLVRLLLAKRYTVDYS